MSQKLNTWQTYSIFYDVLYLLQAISNIMFLF